jgi:flavin reductase (DIM6/NTAB) family NADH-FMN oxidoreductase RutF
MPAVLIGTHVNGKPNFMTAAWCGIVNSDPPMLSVSIRPHRHTYRGVKQTGAFSVNVPGVDLAVQTDYCGLVSGAREEKAAACGFRILYGKLESVPLIQECPVNVECRVMHELNLGSHALFIGRIEEVHVSEDCLTQGKPDAEKIRPLVYCAGARNAYRGLGEEVAQAFHAGAHWKKSGKA